MLFFLFGILEFGWISLCNRMKLQCNTLSMAAKEYQSKVLYSGYNLIKSVACLVWKLNMSGLFKSKQRNSEVKKESSKFFKQNWSTNSVDPFMSNIRSICSSFYWMTVNHELYLRRAQQEIIKFLRITEVAWIQSNSFHTVNQSGTFQK